jgi:RNA polymerase sigma-70 factor (sigma-E family)
METELSEGDAPASEPDPSTTGHAAFVAAFDTLYFGAYQQAYKLLGDRQEAEDLAQEACARACIRWQQLDDPPAWVVHVVTNLAFDRFRRLRSAARYARFPAAAASVTGAGVSDAHLDLHRALAKLPKRQREAVALRYLGDLSEEQTAAALGCSPGTVKSHTARGLRALRLTSDLADEVETS